MDRKNLRFELGGIEDNEPTFVLEKCDELRVLRGRQDSHQNGGEGWRGADAGDATASLSELRFLVRLGRDVILGHGLFERRWLAWGQEGILWKNVSVQSNIRSGIRKIWI